MKILNITDENVFIESRGNNKRPEHDLRAIFVDGEVYDYVSKFLEPRRQFLQDKLNECPTPGTCAYWEENWHNKLVKDIVTESNFEDRQVSNSLNAYFGY